MAIQRILLVDDDRAFRESLAEQFELHDEFSTEQEETGTDGLQNAKSGQFDLILLDVGLPDLDGREVCKMMRKSGVKCPIVMLTGVEGDADTPARCRLR